LKHPCAPIRAIRCLRPTSLPKAGTGTSTWLRSIPIIQNPIRSASTSPICSNCSTMAINEGGPEHYGDRRRRNSNCRCPHGRVSHSSSQLRDSNPPPIRSLEHGIVLELLYTEDASETELTVKSGSVDRDSRSSRLHAGQRRGGRGFHDAADDNAIGEHVWTPTRISAWPRA
jgi:hypothetical protein